MVLNALNALNTLSAEGISESVEIAEEEMVHWTVE